MRLSMLRPVRTVRTLNVAGSGGVGRGGWRLSEFAGIQPSTPLTTTWQHVTWWRVPCEVPAMTVRVQEARPS